MTKAEIKEKFYELKKWGFDFKNFQSQKRMPFGARGFIDLFIVAPSDWILFIDIKAGKDKPTEAQLEFREWIGRCKYAVHLFATDENTDRLIAVILQKQYHLLRDNE